MVESDDKHSTVELKGFQIILVNMRGEDEFAKDSMAIERGRGMYVYLRAEDVNTKHEELTKAGFKSLTQPRDWEWGNREFILKDPDGYKLCFWQPIGSK